MLPPLAAPGRHLAVADNALQSVVPQFVVFTADDAIQSYTINAVNQFLAHRKNPNGCTPKMTYFTSLNYTNYTLVTDWFVAGNEIAVRSSRFRGCMLTDDRRYSRTIRTSRHLREAGSVVS